MKILIFSGLVAAFLIAEAAGGVLPQDEHDVTKRQANQLCNPGDKWKVDCNDCVCAPSQITLCTKKVCPENGVEMESERVERETKVNCKPGDVWKDDCHTCHCPNGVPACTRELCPSEQGEPLNLDVIIPKEKRETKTTCQEGESWMDDCNSCHCDKGRPACTRELCRSEQEPLNLDGVVGKSKRETKTTCTPGDVFTADDGCNTCSCGPDGMTTACTEMLCLPKDRVVQRRSTSPCTPGTVFAAEDGCNTCNCLPNGNAVCTQMACPGSNRILRIHTECTAGYRFLDKDGCNWCICNEDGKTADCTAKACA